MDCFNHTPSLVGGRREIGPVDPDLWNTTGFVLYPLFFNFYMKLLAKFSIMKKKDIIQHFRDGYLQYPDDTDLYFAIWLVGVTINLNRYLEAIKFWMRKKKLKLNPANLELRLIHQRPFVTSTTYQEVGSQLGAASELQSGLCPASAGIPVVEQG